MGRLNSHRGSLGSIASEPARNAANAARCPSRLALSSRSASARALSLYHSRRQWLQAVGLGVAAGSMSGWLPALAEQLGPDPRRRRHCILLWMSGGPSQTDTFDMKPGHENGGEFHEISTNVPGIKFSEHLPKLSLQADQLAILRGLSTKEGDHARGTYLMRTGYTPGGPINYPAIGATLSKELGEESDALPNYVSIAPYRAFAQEAFGSGFLGPGYSPLAVGATDVLGRPEADRAGRYAELRVDDLAADRSRMAQRVEFWESLQGSFLARHASPSPRDHDTVYRRAMRLMTSKAAGAFDLSQEPDAVRDAYGRGRFGQGCLMARRLIEQGVAFVEVTLGSLGGNTLGWDTHQDNFRTLRDLSAELDSGWSTLMSELAERGLLESTTIVWMGEFGRTPKINEAAGRDHFPAAWTCVLAGGGIRGGQAYGRTTSDGTAVEEGKVGVGDVLATLAAALGVSPETENLSPLGRPIRIAEGKVIKDVLL